MPQSLAPASASLLIRAWLCAVRIRSVFGAISEATTSFGLACTTTSIPAALAAAASRSSASCPHPLAPRRVRGGGEPILGVVHHDPDDVDLVLPEHVQGRHAKMAGADKGDPHGRRFLLRWGVDSMPTAAVIPEWGGSRRFINSRHPPQSCYDLPMAHPGQIGRRTFVGLLGALALAGQAASAQQEPAGRARKLGFLT